MGLNGDGQLLTSDVSLTPNRVDDQISIYPTLEQRRFFVGLDGDVGEFRQVNLNASELGNCVRRTMTPRIRKEVNAILVAIFHL